MLAHSMPILRSLWSVQSLSNKFINIPGKAQFREGAAPPYKTISLFFSARKGGGAERDGCHQRQARDHPGVNLKKLYFSSSLAESQ